MTFAAPLFLLAVLAGAIPVVLHMINRQQAKDLPFSTLRFLRISVEKTRRRKRVHDVLLMLLRVAVLLLIALGLAKPTITSLGSLLGGSDSAVVVVLDNSASMGTIDADRMRFDTGVAAAMQILDELQDGDQVAMVVTSGPTFPELGKLERNQETVRQILPQLQVSYEKADLGVAVQQAQKLLVDADAQNKQIWVVTDLQELSWESFQPQADDSQSATGVAQAGESEDAETQEKLQQVPIILVDTNQAPRPNVAVQGVEIDAPIPVAGLPVKATVELLNPSPVPQSCHLELFVNGTKEASSPDLSVPAESRMTHVFDFAFQRGGLQRGEVRLGGEDGSRLDDRRFFTLEVDQGIPVAVVSSRHHEIPYLDDTFYLRAALEPTDPDAGGWAIRTTPLTANDLLSADLSKYTVIFCVNLSAPSSDAAERLKTFVENGGNLVWVAGDNVDVQAYNQMNEAAEGKLLPAPLLELRTPGVGDDRDSWNVSYLDKEYPALSHLAEPASLYESILVYKHVRMDAGAAVDARTLLGLDDGEPLMAQRNVEKGKTLFLGTSTHVGWTNLPLRPIFLPMIARLAFELAGAEQSQHMTLAGAPLVVQFEPGRQPGAVEILPPSGETIRRTPQDEEGQATDEFRYADTHDIGIYLLRLLGASEPKQIAFSVNADPDEAETARIGRDELKKRFGKIPVVYAEDPEDLTSTFRHLREGDSLWGLFLTAVLIALIFESFLSNQLSPKSEEEQLKDVPPGMRRLARKGRAASAA